LRGLSKRYRADVAWEEFDELYQRRLESNDVKVARALERNFARPTTELEQRTKSYIDQHTAQMTAKWETEVFAQRNRKGAAEKSLRTKETKTAARMCVLQPIRSRRCWIAWRILSVPSQGKTTAGSSNDVRSCTVAGGWPYPHQADALYMQAGGKPADYDVRYPSTYNARRDSLPGFWNNVYGRNHAVMVVGGFFENVPRHLFEHRELRPGEKPQNVDLQFDPSPATEMLVACVWDRWSDRAGNELYSFAVVTDEPPEEVAATGHQRCVVALREENLQEWLAPAGLSRDRLEIILRDKECLVYEHQIAA
jgi:putative SOS response-associated peptidase YedK